MKWGFTFESAQETYDIETGTHKKLNLPQRIFLKVIDSWFYHIFMTLLTIYCLFFDDLWILILPKGVDNYFFVFTTICLVVFFLEIILTFIVRKEYRFSFFFWLDIISTISLIFDLDWITERFTYDIVNTTQVLKTSRASWFTRIIWVVRLIRLLRIVKLYKQAKNV